MIDPAWLPAIVTLLVGIVGSIAPVMSALAARRKGEGDFAKTVVDSAAVMVDKLTVRVESLERQVNTLTKENEVLRRDQQVLKAGVALLINQLRALGHQPLWTPPDTELNA